MIKAAKTLGFLLGLAFRGSIFVASVWASIILLNYLGAGLWTTL